MKYLNKAVFLTLLWSPLSFGNTVLEQLSTCAKNNDSLQRLVCYDELAKNSRSFSPDVQQLERLDVSETVKVNNATPEPQKPAPQKMPSKPMPASTKSVVESAAVLNKSAVDTTKQQQAKFGKENKQRTEDLIQQVQGTITKVEKAGYGKLLITLDNGQVWRQTDSTRMRLKSGQVVIIKRAALGSFFIGRDNMNKRIRAKRVK